MFRFLYKNWSHVVWEFKISSSPNIIISPLLGRWINHFTECGRTLKFSDHIVSVVGNIQVHCCDDTFTRRNLPFLKYLTGGSNINISNSFVNDGLRSVGFFIFERVLSWRCNKYWFLSMMIWCLSFDSSTILDMFLARTTLRTPKYWRND